MAWVVAFHDRNPELPSLEEVRARMDGGEVTDESERAHLQLAHADIRRFLERTHEPVPELEPVDPPPGTPIGDGVPEAD